MENNDRAHARTVALLFVLTMIMGGIDADLVDDLGHVRLLVKGQKAGK